MSATVLDVGPDPKVEWINRVLGVQLRRQTLAGGADITAAFQAAVAEWAAALGAADRQMGVLKTALLASGDPEYEDIADQELDGVIGEGPRKLGAVLAQLGRSDAAALKATAAKVLPTLATLHKQIEGNKALAVCEANPLRVPLSIRALLGDAIERLQSVLTAAAG